MSRPVSWMRLLVPLVLVAALAWGLDTAAIRARLGETRFAPVVVALGLAHLVIVASALRWCDTARRIGRPVAPRRAVAEYYVSSLLNQVLPGGVAGDAMRAWRVRDADGTWPALRGVVIERVSGQVALAAALILGLALGGVPGTGVFVAAFAGAVAVVLVAISVMGRFGADLRRAWGVPAAAGIQAVLNSIVVAALIGGFALCARAVGTELDLATALVLVPVCLAAMLLPAGFGGLGLREGAAAVLWPLAGLPAEAGVAAALLFGLVALIAALPGALLLIPHRR